jgi:hypothetical protein
MFTSMLSTGSSFLGSVACGWAPKPLPVEAAHRTPTASIVGAALVAARPFHQSARGAISPHLAGSGTQKTTRVSSTNDLGAPTGDLGAPTGDLGAPTGDLGAPTGDLGAPTGDHEGRPYYTRFLRFAHMMNVRYKMGIVDITGNTSSSRTTGTVGANPRGSHG